MRMVKIGFEKIEPLGFQEKLKDPSCGGWVTFEGRVRNHHGGKEVMRLEYEAYFPMAKKVMEEIEKEARKRFPQVRKTVVVHRVGEIPIGEIALWAAVGATHREEAFGACRFLVEEIKRRAPIWKKEFYADGTSSWVGCAHDLGVEKK